MSEFHSRLRDVVEGAHDELVELAEALAASTALANYSSDELDQLSRAFEQILIEALEGGDGSTRRFVIESAIPAVVAQGETLGSLARGVATWAVILTSYLLERLPDTDRSEASQWLAEFFGTYASDVVDAAVEASR